MKGDETTLTFGRCADCGGVITLQTGPGRTREYLRGLWLAVPDDFGTPACSVCKEEYAVAEVSEKLDALLSQRLTLRINQYVTLIQTRDNVTQQQIEDALGVTRSYLSHLRAGRKEPSSSLFKLLELFAISPETSHHLRQRQPYVLCSRALFAVGSSARIRPGTGFTQLQRYQSNYQAPLEHCADRLVA